MLNFESGQPTTATVGIHEGTQRSVHQFTSQFKSLLTFNLESLYIPKKSASGYRNSSIIQVISIMKSHSYSAWMCQALIITRVPAFISPFAKILNQPWTYTSICLDEHAFVWMNACTVITTLRLRIPDTKRLAEVYKVMVQRRLVLCEKDVDLLVRAKYNACCRNFALYSLLSIGKALQQAFLNPVWVFRLVVIRARKVGGMAEKLFHPCVVSWAL